MKSILVPIDGSLYSTMALEMAKDMAEAFNSKITVLYVMEDEGSNYASNPYTFSPELIKRITTEKALLASKILEDAQKKLSASTSEVETKLLSGNAASEIIEFANNHDIDFLIMGSSGMGGIRGMIGSVARRVTLAINIPTLIVR
ncbi:MAG: universal stress protein [Clostridia bacterium]|nr:universal stress protein [Clostridia bacterium]